MLINEAKWISSLIPSLPVTKESIVLNFGSQSLKYNKENKHILDYVISPLKLMCRVKNLDIQAGPGIDYSGDLFDDQFFNHLKSIKFDGILICNVLEHVSNIQELARRVGELTKPGGFVIFTGPYKYPVHYDPIDNKFRPEVDEVESLFAGYIKIIGEIITDHTYSFYISRTFKTLVLTLIRLLTPFYKFEKWKNVVLPKFSWWNKRFQVTCVLLKKTN